MSAAASKPISFQELNGIPSIDVPANVRAALAKGHRATGIAIETARLRFGLGKLTPQEYFYYRLWDERVTPGPAKAFAGKLAQHPMHVAAGNLEWFAASADKILFHSIMTSARYRVPQTLAITQAGRHMPDLPTIANADDLAHFLRDPSLYPLFAKQVAGKYSLSVVSADSYEASSDEVVLLGGERRAVAELAALLVGGAGYLIQRRLAPALELAMHFGPRLCSARLLVFVTPEGPVNGADDDVSVGRDPLKAMCNRISAFKDALVIPSEAAAHVEAQIARANGTDLRVDPHHLRMAARVYVEYQRVLRDANAADFGDLLLWPVRAMQANRDYLGRWAGRFDAVLADEYQDVNQAQYSWLRLLAASHGELFAVGDDDQAVYSWRGADIRYIRRFSKDFPNATQVRLEENFRSTGHILSGANAVIAQDRSRLGKTLYTRKPSGDPIEVVGFRNAEAEALGIAAEIQRRHAEGVNWQDMAILYRSNALSRGFEESLMRGRIPYVLIGDVGFYQRAEIKDTLALLRLSATPDDVQGDEAFRRVINVPARGFGPKALDAIEQEAAFRQVSLLQALETAELPPKARSAGLAFADAVRGVGRDRAATVADQISLLLDATGYRAMLRESKAETTEDRLENIQELIGLAGGFHTARELLDHAALSTSGPQDKSADRVRLMTMHKAKGLEFPQVFLPAWEGGTFPPDYGDISEERRLGYVAVTRGMRRVTITHCEFRRGYTCPSSFIDDLPKANKVKGWLRGHPGSVNITQSDRRRSSALAREDWHHVAKR